LIYPEVNAPADSIEAHVSDFTATPRRNADQQLVEVFIVVTSTTVLTLDVDGFREWLRAEGDAPGDFTRPRAYAVLPTDDMSPLEWLEENLPDGTRRLSVLTQKRPGLVQSYLRYQLSSPNSETELAGVFVSKPVPADDDAVRRVRVTDGYALRRGNGAVGLHWYEGAVRLECHTPDPTAKPCRWAVYGGGRRHETKDMHSAQNHASLWRTGRANLDVDYRRWFPATA
jgi:hypothetical protein